MATTAYAICLGISVLAISYIAFKNYENINTYYWTIAVLLPITILGYYLKTRVVSAESIKVIMCYIYLDSTIMPTVVIFSMLSVLGVKIKLWEKFVGYGAAFAHMILIWACLDNDLYYANVDVITSPNGNYTILTSGPLKVIHMIYLGLMLAVIIVVLIMGYLKKGSYSRKSHQIYTSVYIVALILYSVERACKLNYSLLPAFYAMCSIFVAYDYDRAHMHDITSLISTQRTAGSKGYVAFDKKRRFVSCNERAYDFIPELRTQLVDAKLKEDNDTTWLINDLIESYDRCGKASAKFNVGNITCSCEVNSFSVGNDGPAKGYIIDFRDSTKEQKMLDVMTSYSETLNADIEKITGHVVEIQQKIVVGMANIIENRDNNTGGHVKRTSDVIKIIVDEIVSQGEIRVNSKMAADIVRAAPMHDLGKISIDSTILCKPGKLTDEEFEIMKTHSVKSGEMVHIILDGIEEQHFVDTAFNIAKHHHERWDGKGYPDGLAGAEIPLEARIMAIADVYDALVSERCYKKPMSFEQAQIIMCEGMGSQFDPGLEKVFLGCREKLEAYYSAQK